MVQFQIPKFLLAGFEAIITLEPTQVDIIVKFLNSMPIGLGPNKFKDDLYEILPELRNTQVIPTVYTFGEFEIGTKDIKDEQELAQSLTNSFKRQLDNKFSEEENEKLKSYLASFLSSSAALRLTAKAFKLLVESQNVFTDAHIVSDVRLLFKKELEEKDRTGIILHQLKISMQSNEESEQVFFSLNMTDLLNLQSQIERAIKKEEIIRSDYKSVSFITFTE